MLNVVGVEHIQQQMCWSGFGFEEREMDLREIEKEERSRTEFEFLGFVEYILGF